MAESHHHQQPKQPHPHAQKPSHYWVMAKICEPKYDQEMKFLEAELAFVDRKIEQTSAGLSLQSLGFYSRKDWIKYARKLEHYAGQLAQYAEDIDDGVLPLKFMVYNAAELKDSGIHVSVKVKGGRVDEMKKPPERPERLDGHGKGLPKLFFPRIGFSRTSIKITPHSISAVLSGLGPNDGAVLVNQLVHVHLGASTEVTYEIMSGQVSHEKGDVDLAVKQPATS